MIVDDEEVLFESEVRDGASIRVCASPRGARIELSVTRAQLMEHRAQLRMFLMHPGAPPEAIEAFQKLEKYLDEPPAAPH